MWGSKTPFSVHRILTNPNGMLQVISPELLSSSTKLTDDGKLTDFFHGFDLLLSKLKIRNFNNNQVNEHHLDQNTWLCQLVTE